MQHLGAAACLLCIAQRVFFLAFALFAGASAWVQKRSSTVSGLLTVVSQAAVFAGAVMAAQQTQLVLHPSNVCAVDYWAATLNQSRPARVAPWLLRADGVCSQAPHVLGVSLPVWSLLVFALLEVLLILAWRARIPPRVRTTN
jgi:disulfide bond formation protein DsbB